MSIYALPGQTNVEATVQGFPTGLTGTIGFRIRDNAGADFLARRTTGITEDIAGSGVYRTTFTAPTTAGQYTLFWDRGSVSPSGVATEELEVTVTLPTFSISTALDYITETELKATLTMTGTSFADADLASAITSASREVDNLCGQRFYADPDATSVRYYTANGLDTIWIDPLITLTSLATDPSDLGVYGSTWVNNTDFVLQPRNAPADGAPYNTVRKLAGAGFSWPSYPDGVKVTGRFGWPSVPQNIRVATAIIAAKLVKRMREAPWGVIGFGGDGTVVRMSQYDPELDRLLAPYTIRQLVF